MLSTGKDTLGTGALDCLQRMETCTDSLDSRIRYGMQHNAAYIILNILFNRIKTSLQSSLRKTTTRKCSRRSWVWKAGTGAPPNSLDQRSALRWETWLLLKFHLTTYLSAPLARTRLLSNTTRMTKFPSVCLKCASTFLRVNWLVMIQLSSSSKMSWTRPASSAQLETQLLFSEKFNVSHPGS